MLKRQAMITVAIGVMLAFGIMLAGCSQTGTYNATNENKVPEATTSSVDASSTANVVSEAAKEVAETAKEAAKEATSSDKVAKTAEKFESRPPVDDSPYIGESIARGCALSNAFLTVHDVSDVEVELDEDAEVVHYDVSFKTDDTEYEYEINAETGSIVSKQVKEIK